ncbi:MAG: FKBP-type peptidyl-prolyl cis-trans isomerase [Flavobacteriales bacterium]
MKRLLIYFTLALFLLSCSNDPDGYSHTKSGLVYRFTFIGDGDKPAVGDYVKFKYVLKTMTDSLIDSSRLLVQLVQLKDNGQLEEGLAMMKKEDKANFIVSANDFYKTYLEAEAPAAIHGRQLNIEVEILDILSDLQFEKSMLEFQVRLASTKMDTTLSAENEEIAKFLSTYQFKMDVFPSGLKYFFIKQSTLKKRPCFGKTVHIHYSGRFLNGKEFNSTRVAGIPQDFIIGQEMQVIQGIEEMLLYMNEGDVVGMIIPSKLAFGSSGSSSGIVPPNTPVYYELELLSVN